MIDIVVQKPIFQSYLFLFFFYQTHKLFKIIKFIYYISLEGVEKNESSGVGWTTLI